MSAHRSELEVAGRRQEQLVSAQAQALVRLDDAAPGAASQALVRVPDQLETGLRFHNRKRANLRRLLGWHTVGGGFFVAAAFVPTPLAPVAIGVGVGAVVGSWVTTGMSELASGRILRARVMASRHPEKGLRALERLATSPWVRRTHRLEAAGHAALISLEAGDLERAKGILARQAADRQELTRDRALEKGLIGELLRSIVSWLSAEDLGTVASSTAFELEPSQREDIARRSDVTEFNDLVSMLRLLEATGAEDTRAVVQAWHHVAEGNLARRFPGLFLIARAAAAPHVSSVREKLQWELAREQVVREHLERVFPHFDVGLSAEAPYREEAELPGVGDETDRALAVMAAPDEVRNVARRGARRDDMLRVGLPMRGPLALAALTAVGIPAGVMVMAFLTMWPAAAAVAMFAAFFGLPLLFTAGSIRWMALARRRARLAPLILPPARPPPEHWIREFERSPQLQGTSGDLRPEHMMLYVACVQAEQLLDAGNTAEAWNRLEWWFRGFSEQSTQLTPLFPVASTLLRVAALAGRLADAKVVSRVLTRMPATGTRKRTLYGSSPRALAYARAILAGRGGRWEEVASELSIAARHPHIYLPVRDHALLVRLGERARAHGHACPDDGNEQIEEEWQDEEFSSWIAKVWPGLNR